MFMSAFILKASQHAKCPLARNPKNKLPQRHRKEHYSAKRTNILLVPMIHAGIADMLELLKEAKHGRL